jgi:hypothetical protein
VTWILAAVDTAQWLNLSSFITINGTTCKNAFMHLFACSETMKLRLCCCIIIIIIIIIIIVVVIIEKRSFKTDFLN